MSALKTQLKEAQQELAALQAELPRYHGLLTENEAEAARLRAERAPLDAQAQAKGRATVARELLEQHQHDIGEARVKVERLEAACERERVLGEMAKYAKVAKQEHAAFDEALTNAGEALAGHVAEMVRAWNNWQEARESFLGTGGELARAFTTSHANFSVEGERLRAEGRAVLAELEARGVDYSEVLTARDRERSVLDRGSSDAPNPAPFSDLILLAWSGAMDERVKQRAAEKMHELMNRTKSPVYLTAAPAGGGKYRI